MHLRRFPGIVEFTHHEFELREARFVGDGELTVHSAAQTFRSLLFAQTTFYQILTRSYKMSTKSITMLLEEVRGDSDLHRQSDRRYLRAISRRDMFCSLT